MKDKPEVPEILNQIADKVLAYRPKPKSKGAKKRTRKKHSEVSHCRTHWRNVFREGLQHSSSRRCAKICHTFFNGQIQNRRQLMSDPRIL